MNTVPENSSDNQSVMIETKKRATFVGQKTTVIVLQILCLCLGLFAGFMIGREYRSSNEQAFAEWRENRLAQFACDQCQAEEQKGRDAADSAEPTPPFTLPQSVLDNERCDPESGNVITYNISLIDGKVCYFGYFIDADADTFQIIGQVDSSVVTVPKDVKERGIHGYVALDKNGLYVAGELQADIAIDLFTSQFNTRSAQGEFNQYAYVMTEGLVYINNKLHVINNYEWGQNVLNITELYERNIDYETLQSIGNNYFKDKNFVFYFEVLNSFGSLQASGDSIVNMNMSPDSFYVLKQNDRSVPLGINTQLDTVYYMGKLLPGLSARELVTEQDNYILKDGDTVYVNKNTCHSHNYEQVTPAELAEYRPGC